MDLTRSNAVKEEIRSRLDIAQVVGRYVTLKPVGRNMKGLCPFHKEKTPSFMVSSERGIYHCFGCGKGGDVFSFLMEKEGLDFKEVLAMCAAETGVRLETHEPPRAASAATATGSGALTKTELLRIHEVAARFFYDQMRRSPHAIDYLKSRGLTGQTAREFQLGFAPQGWSNLCDFAATQRISPESLAACGLAIRHEEKGSWYDRFRNRLIFPLFDLTGRIIAFAGRGMDKESQPKYLNSPETLLYHKSRTLYGLHKAREYIRDEGFLTVVEGYMDFLTLYQHGIRNCVATSGTALTAEHGGMIRRFTERVVLLFDGDNAGVKAAQRGVSVLAAFGLDVRVCLLPSQHDPDTYVIENGVDNLKSLLVQAQGGIRFLLEQYIGVHGLATPHAKAAVTRELSEVLCALQDPIVRSESVKMVADRLALEVAVVEREIRTCQGRPQAAAPEPVMVIDRQKFFGTLEARFLSLLLHHAELVETALERISPETLNDQFSMNLYSVILATHAVDPTLKSVLDHSDDPLQRSVLTQLVMDDPGAAGAYADEGAHVIKRLQIKALKNRMRAIRLQQKATDDPQQMQALQQELVRVTGQLKELDGGWTKKADNS